MEKRGSENGIGKRDIRTFCFSGIGKRDLKTGQVTGRLDSIRDDLSKKTHFSYNDRSQTTRIWGDVPQPQEIAYHSTYGERTSLKTYRSTSTDWNETTWPASPGTADETTWSYHEATGLLTTKTYADSKTTTYTYTSDGRLDVRTWARTVSSNPLTTDYGYDAITGELTTINYSDSTPDVTFTYDRLGRTATVVDAVGTRTFAYNSALQLSTETFSNGILSKVITRRYETSGVPGRYNELWVGVSADPDQDYDVDYLYDSKGRLSRITGPGLPSYGAEYTFLTNSDMVQKTQFKSGSSTVVAEAVRSFESQRDLVTQVENIWKGSPDTTLSKYVYHYDNLGRRIDVATTGEAFNLDRFTLFTYNDRSELLTSKRYNGTDLEDLDSPVAAQQYEFNFDPIGNRVDYTGEDPQVTTNYTKNNLNQYTSIDEESDPDWSITYDFDGNMTQDDQFDYTWDAENRLTTVTPRNPISGSMKSVFTYDYMSRRVRKQIYLYAGGQWNSTPSIDRKFVYDQWNLLVELNALSSDAVLEKYTWGLDLSGQAGNNTPSPSQGEGWGEGGLPGLHNAGGIGGLLSMYDAGTSTSLLYTFNANGDVGQLVKLSDGSFGAKYQYYPYGGEIQAVGTYATTNPFRFSTKYWDAEHQAFYYGYRYHKPKLGRWLSRDPLQEQGGTNLYEHTRNAPACSVDSLGLVCGSGWNDGIIPDGIPGLYDFTNCCQQHDDCYSTCGSLKADCDDAFYECMKAVCNSMHLPGSPGLEWCMGFAADYYSAVVSFGNDAYNNAQANCKPQPKPQPRRPPSIITPEERDRREREHRFRRRIPHLYHDSDDSSPPSY